MEPSDIIWRLRDRLNELQRLCEESIQDLDPKKNADLISSIEECERLCRTQINTMNRIAKKY
jgi:tRNA uridine 5-carbamoylmethylation protein Kti12